MMDVGKMWQSSIQGRCVVQCMVYLLYVMSISLEKKRKILQLLFRFVSRLRSVSYRTVGLVRIASLMYLATFADNTIDMLFIE